MSFVAAALCAVAAAARDAGIAVSVDEVVARAVGSVASAVVIAGSCFAAAVFAVAAAVLAAADGAWARTWVVF